MVDAVITKLSELRRQGQYTYRVNITAKSGSFHHVPNSSRLVVILPYWHAKTVSFASYLAKLHAKDKSTLFYDLEPQMLQAHVSQVVANFSEMAERVVDEILTMQLEFGFDEVELHGFSLGNTLVGMVLSRLDTVRSLHLVVPGDSLAACLWRSIATRTIRAGLEAQGISEAELERAWRPLSLTAYAEEIAHKVPDIHITLAKADRFIPYDRGKRLVRELERNGAEVHLREWRMGHGATILRSIRTFQA